MRNLAESKIFSLTILKDLKVEAAMRLQLRYALTTAIADNSVYFPIRSDALNRSKLVSETCR